MKVVPVPVRSDNYAYLLIDEPSKTAAAVDPYDVDKVVAAAEEHGVDIVAALITHHHQDHSGGNTKFAATYPKAPIYGGSDRIPALTDLVKDGTTFPLGEQIRVQCLATPCHTQDSICYYVQDDSQHKGGVFTGDTLFIAGCGRFFEGTGEEMDRALSYLGTLPNPTLVYNGHEYTAGNLAFADHIDPNNTKRLARLVRGNKITTGLSTIGDEKEWNVFMRLDDPAVRGAASVETGAPRSVVMDWLREAKNNFKGYVTSLL